MTYIKNLQDIHIEPLKIYCVGSRNVLSTKNKNDLLKILNKHQVFDNQSNRSNVLSISSEKAVLLLQVYNKKVDIKHLDKLSATILAKKVNKLANNLLITKPKSLGNSEILNPLTEAVSLPVTFSLKFIHSFENALLSSAKVASSASSMALVTDAIRSYKAASKSHDDVSRRFALFQGLYGTLQGILGAEALSLTFVNLLDANSKTIHALSYIGALSGVLTVIYLNIRSAFNLNRHNEIMSPIINMLKDSSTSEKKDQIAQYLKDKVSITSEDIEDHYKCALESCDKDSNPTLLPKAEKYLFKLDEWYEKNLHKLLNGLEKDQIEKLETLETPFKIALANQLVTVHESKIGIFEAYVGAKALKQVQSNALSNQELVEMILKESKSYKIKQYIVIALSILATCSLATATIATGGIGIAASAIFMGILALVAYSDIINLLSKLKDHILTQKEKLAMTLHIISSLLILASTVGIGVAMGAATSILVSATVIALLPLLLYAYILWEANRQLEKQGNESARKILSNSL